MKYIPKFSWKEIEQNHRHYIDRITHYRNRGFDFEDSRRFIIEKVHPLKGKILEIGTGNGYTTLTLAREGYRFISIDKDKEALRITASNLAYEGLLKNVAFYIMDAKKLTFDDESFNNIVVVNLFHHIDDVDDILSGMDRVLHRFGKIVMADFNSKGMKIIDKEHKEEGRIHKNSCISKEYISSYFNALGYDIEGFDEKYHWILRAEKKIRP